LQTIHESEYQKDRWQAVLPRVIFCEKSTIPSCAVLTKITELPDATDADEIDKTNGVE